MLNEHINFAGKTAVVTGASRGIGEAAGMRLAKAGANVVLLARSENDILKHSQTIGDKALACVCDVSNWSEVESAFAKAIERFGAIDILINNAGVIDPVARLEDADPHEWGRAVDINLKGVFHGIRAALPVMKNKLNLLILLNRITLYATPKVVMPIYISHTNIVHPRLFLGLF